MHGVQKSPRRGQVAAAFMLVYVLWGSTYLGIRFAIETLPPFLMAGTRHLTAGALLYTWNRLRGAPPPSCREWLAAGVIGALLLFGGNGLVTWSEQRVPSGVAALIVASVPLWMALIDGLQQRRIPAARVLAGVALGLGGLALLIAPGGREAERVDSLGAAALVLAALSWVGGSLLSRRIRFSSATSLVTALEMIAGGVLLELAGVARGEPSQVHLREASVRSLLAFGYLVIFGSLVAFSAYMWLLKVSTPARVSTYAYVNPVVAVLLGWAFAGESLTARIGLSALVIVGAVALIIRYDSAREGIGEVVSRR